MAAPFTRRRTPTGTGAEAPERVRMEAGRVGEGKEKPFLRNEDGGRRGASRRSAKGVKRLPAKKKLDRRGPLMEARVRRKPAAVAHQQGRGPVPAHVAGAGSAYHTEPACSRYGPETLGPETGRARRAERQEARDRGGGAQAGGATASLVGMRRGVRTIAQQSDSE